MNGKMERGQCNKSRMTQRDARMVLEQGLKETLSMPMMPRSSSPVTVYVELPCLVEQALSSIVWNTFEESASAEMQDISSITYGAKDCDSQDHGLDYPQEFTTDYCVERALVPFQCGIPPLTPQREFFPVHSGLSLQDQDQDQDQENWEEMPQYHGCVLSYSAENHQLQETLDNKQGEMDVYEEKNCRLKQLATRAKQLATLLEKLTTRREPSPGGPSPDTESPPKRQRLDEGYETEPDSVEDLLRDLSTRCNAVLQSATTEPVRTFGAFSGLRTCFSDDGREQSGTEGPEGAEAGFSFSLRASVQEHSTIRTLAFPHGHAFTTRTRSGGYGFRWVPN